jgi:hypothetical protein
LIAESRKSNAGRDLEPPAVGEAHAEQRVNILVDAATKDECFQAVADSAVKQCAFGKRVPRVKVSLTVPDEQQQARDR